MKKTRRGWNVPSVKLTDVLWMLSTKICSQRRRVSRRIFFRPSANHLHRSLSVQCSGKKSQPKSLHQVNRNDRTHYLAYFYNFSLVFSSLREKSHTKRLREWANWSAWKRNGSPAQNQVTSEADYNTHITVFQTTPISELREWSQWLNGVWETRRV